MASTSRSLRSADSDIFLVGKFEKNITGAKLPSKRQVLQTLFHHIRIEKVVLRRSARIVAEEVLEFWNKARIPTIHIESVVTAVKSLYNALRKIQKIRYSKSDTHKQQIKDYTVDLDMLFDVASSDALELIKIPEDAQFLLKQREPGRPGRMIGIDMNLTLKEQKRMKRIEEEELRKRKHEAEGMNPRCNFLFLFYKYEFYYLIEAAETSQTENVLEFDVCDSNEDDEQPIEESSGNADEVASESLNADSFNLSQTLQKRGKKNFIDDRMLACMDFENMSTPGAVRLISATVAALGIDIKPLVLNKTSVYRMRKEFRARKARDMLENYDVNE